MQQTIRQKIITSFLLLLVCSTSLATSVESKKRAVAFGEYMQAIAMLDNLKNSDCSYVFKNMEFSYSEAFNEGLKNLKIKERDVLEKHVKSNEFREFIERSTALYHTSMKKMTSTFDKKTMCGFFVGIKLSSYQFSLDKLKQLKNTPTIEKFEATPETIKDVVSENNNSENIVKIIHSIPELSDWYTNNDSKWKLAISIDNEFKEKTKYNDLSLRERFLLVVDEVKSKNR